MRLLNPILGGWANFYRHEWGAKRVFIAIDHYERWTILRWLCKRHPETSMGETDGVFVRSLIADDRFLYAAVGSQILTLAK